MIAITRIANRRAGYWCCFWLVLMGILGKFSGALLAIPNPILGGVTTFLFASVLVSGLKILAGVRYTRRNRFILTCALALGLVDILSSDFFSYLFADVHTSNRALAGFLNSIVIILSTPFLLAAIVASLLNAILPMDIEDYVADYELQAPAAPGLPLHLPPNADTDPDPEADLIHEADADKDDVIVPAPTLPRTRERTTPAPDLAATTDEKSA